MKRLDFCKQRRTKPVGLAEDPRAKQAQKRRFGCGEVSFWLDESIEVDAIDETCVTKGRTSFANVENVDIALRAALAARPRPVKDRRMATVGGHDIQEHTFNVVDVHETGKIRR